MSGEEKFERMDEKETAEETSAAGNQDCGRKQCNTIHDLHYELKRIRKMPKQALIISDYVLYMMEYVVERNEPTAQLNKLEEIFEKIKEEELPTTREEFESRAMLYHILMDLEDFLVYKKRFVNSLDEKQKNRYWNQGK